MPRNKNLSKSRAILLNNTASCSGKLKYCVFYISFNFDNSTNSYPDSLSFDKILSAQLFT